MTATTITNEHLQDAIIQLTNYAYQWNLTEDDQQDIIIRFIQTFQPDKGTSPTTWVTYLAKQHLFTKARPSQKRTGSLSRINHIEGAEDFHTALHTTQEMEFIQKEQEAIKMDLLTKLLDVLTPKQRLIINAQFFEGKNQYQLAEELNMTPQGICIATKTAIRKMQRHNNNINPFIN